MEVEARDLDVDRVVEVGLEAAVPDLVVCRHPGVDEVGESGDVGRDRIEGWHGGDGRERPPADQSPDLPGAHGVHGGVGQVHAEPGAGGQGAHLGVVLHHPQGEDQEGHCGHPHHRPPVVPQGDEDDHQTGGEPRGLIRAVDQGHQGDHGEEPCTPRPALGADEADQAERGHRQERGRGVGVGQPVLVQDVRGVGDDRHGDDEGHRPGDVQLGEGGVDAQDHGQPQGQEGEGRDRLTHGVGQVQQDAHVDVVEGRLCVQVPHRGDQVVLQEIRIEQLEGVGKSVVAQRPHVEPHPGGQVGQPGDGEQHGQHHEGTAVGPLPGPDRARGGDGPSIDHVGGRPLAGVSNHKQGCTPPSCHGAYEVARHDNNRCGMVAGGRPANPGPPPTDTMRG